MSTKSLTIEFWTFQISTLSSVIIFIIFSLMASIAFIENMTQPSEYQENTIFGAVMMIIFALGGFGGLWIWFTHFKKNYKKLEMIYMKKKEEEYYHDYQSSLEFTNQ